MIDATRCDEDRSPPDFCHANLSGGSFRHINPTTGRPQATIPLAGETEIGTAAAAADAAFKDWRKWRPGKRRDILLELARLVDVNKKEFVRCSALEIGMPVTLGAMSVDFCSAWIRYYAGWVDKIGGAVAATFGTDDQFSYVLAQPYGVIGAILTWNGALMSLGMKVGPALAAGNTLVVKGSELTPFSTCLFERLTREAGIPEGVLTILTGGPEAGAALVRHRAVKKVSFTGGVVTARKILAACAEQIKPAVVELGGKSANLIFPDADLDIACGYSANMAIGLASGQGCLLPTRLLVHRAIYAEVVERVVAIAKGIRVGDPFDPTIMSGPIVSEAASERVLESVRRARHAGSGKLLLGGNRLGGPLADGYFVEPTVFGDVDPLSDLAQDEIFGPVLAIIQFEDEMDAVRIANSTPYGLAAFIQTRDVKRAHRLAEELHAGTVFVNEVKSTLPNTPFGGLGASGYGREGGRQGLDEFLISKAVSIT
jgi:aldehyde dehydrogenase (NAD+)